MEPKTSYARVLTKEDNNDDGVIEQEKDMLLRSRKKKAKCKADGRGVLGEGVSKEDFVIDENERSYL